MIPSDELRRLTTRYDIANQPGYLSYPAVTKWKQQLSRAAVEEACSALADDAYLYFHFPYCEVLCYYCACYMRVTSNPKERYDEYIGALERELELKLASRATRPTVGEMHWGGGTPTYMDCAQIERVFRAIDRRVAWSPSATLSIEAYPDERTLGKDKLRLLRDLGFSQVSLGVESLDPKVLRAINRWHELPALRRMVDSARRMGFGVHVDLVYGLPFQSTESLRRTLEELASVEPDRLATFPFLYTPTTIEHQRVIERSSVPGSLERFHLHRALSAVEERGYRRVGCDHWVRGAGDPLLAAAQRGEVIYHFQGYEPLSRRAFLGFGSSAISFLGDLYFQNEQDVKAYVRTVGEGAIPYLADRCAILDADDRARHFVILKQILADLRIDKASFAERFGARFDDYFQRELAPLRALEADGIVQGVDGDAIEVTPLGRSFIRSVALVFDRYFGTRDRRGRLAVV